MKPPGNYLRSRGISDRATAAPQGVRGSLEKPEFWKNSKRYYDLKSYWQNLFGVKVYKLSLDAGFTCPNRDGMFATGGCIYCDGRGSRLRQNGPLPAIAEQIAAGKAFYEKHRQARKFIAYFQTYTNTYRPAAELAELYREALAQKDIIGLSIGTRPDCLGPEVLDLLAELASACHLWLELGLQSIHDKTLRLINRGHDYRCFLEALEAAAGKKINICVHIILGLPGESRAEMLATARALAKLPVDGIKIHSLLALSGTALGEDYRKGLVTLLKREEYVSLVCDILEVLPPEMVIQRLTADGYQDILLGPRWAGGKLAVLNAIEAKLAGRDSFQGRCYQGKGDRDDRGH